MPDKTPETFSDVVQLIRKETGLSYAPAARVLDKAIEAHVAEDKAQAVTQARRETYTEAAEKTVLDLLEHLPNEMATPKATKLLKEYVAILKISADLEQRHNVLVKDSLMEALRIKAADPQVMPEQEESK